MLCATLGTRYCYPIKSAVKAPKSPQFFDTSVLVERLDGSIGCYDKDEIIEVDLTGKKPCVGTHTYRIEGEVKHYFD